MIYVIAAILFIAIASYLKRNWKAWYYRNDIDFPVAQQRKDMYYGYYSCMAEQVAETKDHINLLHESQFNGQDKCLQNILDARVDVSLDVSFQVFTKTDPKSLHTVRTDARERLRDMFQFLANHNALKYVKILYPIDEPNNTVSDANELIKGINIIRDVAKDFVDLQNVKYAVIYAADKPFIGIDYFDYVGFDDYEMKSNILLSDKYIKLRNNLKSYQKTIIIPGGAYGQDPKPFLNYANNNQEVGIIMPFLWFDDPWGNVGALGIRSNANKSKYIEVGKACCTGL